MANKAKITLVGPLSLSVGRYRFFKDRPVLSDDDELIRYCEFNPDFKVSKLSDDGAAPKKAVPRSEIREKKEEVKKPEPKPVQKAKPEPVEVPDALDSSDSEEASVEEAESSSRLTRKKKPKGDDA